MPDMPVKPRYDIDFAVPFRHRLRFTDDVFGQDLRVLLELLEPAQSFVRVMTVLDDGLLHTSPGLAGRIEAAWRSGPRVRPVGPAVRVKGGEASKQGSDVVDRLLALFNEADLDRRNYVVVVGGGAVLDAVGFAAAVAHRGLRLIRIPSTTLAQADSGVGVKNAVNLFGKKNWMGSFAVPWAVVNDTAILSTLPDVEFRCGFTEAIKVALLKDVGFWERLCEQMPLIARRDPQASRYAIERSAWWHLHHITRGGDPFETREARPLDFGHWSAHKLEAMTGFSLRHGEAVGLGLRIDTLYSSLAHGLDPAVVRRVAECLDQLNIPKSHPALSRTDELLSGLEEFRQHLGGQLTVAMLEAPGQPIDVHEIDAGAMREAITRIAGSPVAREQRARVPEQAR